MFVPDEQDHTDGHHRSCANLQAGPSITEERNCQQCAGKRRSCEHRRLAGRSKYPKRVRIQQDGNTVRKGTDDKCDGEQCQRVDALTTRQGEIDVHERGCAGLHCDNLKWISDGQSLSQVVVQRPSEARSANEYVTERVTAPRRAPRSERGGRGEHDGGTRPRAPTQVFAEREYADEKGERPLEVEEE